MTVSTVSSGVSPHYLDVTKRPLDVREAISTAFATIVTDRESSWGVYNGDEGYFLGGVNEYALMQRIILEAPRERREFYALDIGAGNFQWGRGLAQFLGRAGLTEGTRVHIVSVRGESSLQERVIETGPCILYRLGAFRVEELVSQLRERGLFAAMERNVDLIVSRWCFRHLVDPVGTFVQAYDLLRPGSGLFLGDGFFFSQAGEEGLVRGGTVDYNRRMVQLLGDIGAPFFIRDYDYGRSLNQFVLQRADTTPCQLPMSYTRVQPIADGWQVGSRQVTQFQRTPRATDEEKLFIIAGRSYYTRGDNNLRGDKNLKKWLEKENLFRSKMVWHPLYERDRAAATPRLHNAIRANDFISVQNFLNEGDDQTERDLDHIIPFLKINL